ncbi:uncharacterized protein LOC131010305 [Salvia miltiorrhiza]|uniref:uncharacterized protein LOC131010305 n=1 Tax=Salvia miltiorrhiza TaxID=226208 RepID=UPI0025AC222D|nr:uncharacterized protein LOC131010305 [Salvia miltiorrhiza]
MEEKGKGVKRGYGDSTETAEFVILNEPGLVAAVGGIPEHLKIEGAMMLRIPFPISKYRRYLAEDPTERRRVLFEDVKDALEQPPFKKRRRACAICKRPEGVEEDFIIEMNMTPPFPFVIINRPGFVAAVGGIPHELKINDGISFSIPCPVLKYPKVMPEDPTECQNIMYDSYKKAMESDDFIKGEIFM